MRTTALVLLLCASLFVAAQQTPSAATAPDTNTPQPSYVSDELMRAPQPGHPLDPRDVATLTGKDKPQSTPSSGYGYVPYYGTSYGYGGSELPTLSSGNMFAGGSRTNGTFFRFGGFGRRFRSVVNPFAPGVAPAFSITGLRRFPGPPRGFGLKF